MNNIPPSPPLAAGDSAPSSAVPIPVPVPAPLGQEPHGEERVVPRVQFPRPSIEVIANHEHAQRVCAGLAREPLLALDIETFSTSDRRDETDKPATDSFRNRVRLIQLAANSQRVYIFDVLFLGQLPTALRSLLTDPDIEFVGYNIGFDAKNLRHHFGVDIARPVDLYAAAVLAAGYYRFREPGRYSFAGASLHYLGIALDKTQRLSDWSLPQLSGDQLLYAALDAAVIPLLYDALCDAVDAAGVRRAWEIENGVILPIAAIELAGFGVNRKRLRNLDNRWGKQQIQLSYQIMSELGGSLDINSPKQLRQAFLDHHDLDLPSISKSAINALAAGNKTAETVSKYRRLAKLRADYAQSWLQHTKQDGRIHASFRSLGAPTGRISCSSPNIQAIPRNKKLRGCFVPAPGHCFVIADYSTVELRVIADQVADTEMRRCFCDDPPVDPHRRTAAFVTKKSIRSITKEERSRAKPVNFGFSYSLGAERFIEYARDEFEKSFTLAEAYQIRQAFFGVYYGIGAWHRRSRNEGPRRMEARTASNRLRVFDEFVLGEYLNTPIQGTAADGMKRAMALLYPKLAALGARIVNIIHDELVVEVPTANAETARAVVNDCMVAGLQEFLPNVPVVVDHGVFDRWKKP